MQKILAIDDKQDNLVVIKALLKNLLPKTIVFTAQTGQEGVEIARQELPDVILLDLVMPEMDGYEVCKRLRAEETTTHIPIIILTAIRTDSQSRVKALDSGADAFLTKPIDEAELVAQVNAMLRIKRAEDKLRQEKDILEELVQERTKKLQYELEDRRQAEEQIRKVLEERIILLREIHHRTRNNMQVMSTLLGFQANQIKDEHMVQLFRDAQQRINAMALVHQKLHREDLTTVNLQEYIPDLTRTLLMNYSRNPGRITLNLNDIEPVLMTIDTAIPLSLVLNELISNVLKHAFPNSNAGELIIRFHVTEDGTKDLWVRDDGVGLPDDFDVEDTKTTGLWLIKMITKSQLRGTVEFKTIEKGTAVHIRFKEPYYEKRI
jgi:two-component sensor histidine kinase/CheY-like chemotaxis protein